MNKFKKGIFFIALALTAMLSLAIFPKYSMAAKTVKAPTMATKMAKMAKNMPNMSAKMVKMSIRLNAKIAEFQYHKALGAIKGGYYYFAVRHFEKAIVVEPHFAMAYARMGVILCKLGDIHLAIDVLRKGLKYNPNIRWARTKLKRYAASPKVINC
ncbi:hypothetical protein ACMCNP_03610 [Candidatus Acidulodesulfobacterium sp. H_13]|uniref:hypothetical protein n=1 Tax=Candidatus Acidulodesulfobacterium sp. H_13 TaxID=3395470 RepID=UPI003AF49E55